MKLIFIYIIDSTTNERTNKRQFGLFGVHKSKIDCFKPTLALVVRNVSSNKTKETCCDFSPEQPFNLTVRCYRPIHTVGLCRNNK